MPRTGAQHRGRVAEDLALSFLLAQGLALGVRNYRCRGGELDLVMKDGDQWVFVEVRYRRTSVFGSPQATVNAAKQRRIALAAARFLSRHPDDPARFDVVAVSGDPPRIEWIRDAFEAPAFL